MMEMICKAILFDLDGVLVDSSAVVTRHWENWARRNNLSVQDVMAVAHGRTAFEIIRLTAPHLDAGEEASRREMLEVVDTEGMRVYEGARRLVRSLPPDAWAVVTSGAPGTARTRLGFGDYPIPKAFVTAQDVSRSKPDPEPYLLGAGKLGLAPEQCLVVEDAPAGIQAGKAAGMRVLAVATTHRSEELSLADAVVASLEHVSAEWEHGQLRVRFEPAAGNR